jgi:hypothetical protein
MVGYAPVQTPEGEQAELQKGQVYLDTRTQYSVAAILRWQLEAWPGFSEV